MPELLSTATIVAPEARAAAETAPQVVPIAIAAALALCGVVVLGDPWSGSVSLLVGTFDLPRSWNFEAVSFLVVYLAATIAGVIWTRRWPWLILIGAALELPMVVSQVLRPQFLSLGIHWLAACLVGITIAANLVGFRLLLPSLAQSGDTIATTTVPFGFERVLARPLLDCRGTRRALADTDLVCPPARTLFRRLLALMRETPTETPTRVPAIRSGGGA